MIRSSVEQDLHEDHDKKGAYKYVEIFDLQEIFVSI